VHANRRKKILIYKPITARAYTGYLSDWLKARIRLAPLKILMNKKGKKINHNTLLLTPFTSANMSAKMSLKITHCCVVKQGVEKNVCTIMLR